MHRLLSVLAVLSVASADVGAGGGNPTEPIPSYREALDAFQAERATAGGPTINDTDRQVMERAAQDLARAMPDPGLKVGDKATFVIDRSGVIRAAFVDVGYRKRAEPSVIVSALRQLPEE